MVRGFMVAAAAAILAVATVQGTSAVLPVAAAPKAPTLQGETLTATSVDTTCSSSYSGTSVHWVVTGTATGPYPGTFSETGDAGASQLPGFGHQAGGSATFTITSYPSSFTSS